MKYEISGNKLFITLELNGEEVYRDDRSAVHPVKKNSIWLIGKLTFTSDNPINYISFFIPFMSELIWADMYVAEHSVYMPISYNKNVLKASDKWIRMFDADINRGNPIPGGTYTIYFNILVKV